MQNREAESESGVLVFMKESESKSSVEKNTYESQESELKL